ncbi:hypothetical protein KH141_04085 [butyrate-producing bacterium]|nr:hypothetical protein [butyrate-producing bacterium]
MEIVTQETGEVKKVTYRELKVAMDSEMGKTAESFVRIGYLFKMARDTDVLQESGYSSYLEFAEKEYSMDKSQVSRFINIHTKFSDPEDPTRLSEKYQGFGSAKLAIMLTLPDTIIEELTPTFAKSDIQAVKEELEAESKISDLEVIAEQAETAKEADGQQEPDILHQVVGQILDGDLYMRIKIRQALKSSRKEALLQEILAPAGEAMHSVRIKGVGRLMLSVKGLDTEIALINVRSDSKEMYTWETVIRAVEDYCTSHTDPEPEKKTEVVPVQPTEKPEKKKERKVSKVTKAREAEKLPSRSRKVPQEEVPSEQTAPETPTTPVAIHSTAPAGFVGYEKAEEGNRQQESAQTAEPQLEGQMKIEQFPQYLPENYIKCHDGSEVQESEDARIRAEWRRHVENICTPILTYLRQHPELVQKITITEEGIVIE